MAGIVKKPRITKAVLEMKFMRKTKDRIEREKANTEDHNILYAKEITNEMRKATSNYISESSFFFCENLMEGRLSYRGMNPEIERLMEQETKQELVDGEMPKDISDEILAKKMAAFHKNKRAHTTLHCSINVVKRKKYS